MRVNNFLILARAARMLFKSTAPSVGIASSTTLSSGSNCSMKFILRLLQPHAIQDGMLGIWYVFLSFFSLGFQKQHETYALMSCSQKLTLNNRLPLGKSSCLPVAKIPN